jgi:hypothetical protein
LTWKPALLRAGQRSDGTAGLQVGMAHPNLLATDLSGLTLFLAAGYNLGFCGLAA